MYRCSTASRVLVVSLGVCPSRGLSLWNGDDVMSIEIWVLDQNMPMSWSDCEPKRLVLKTKEQIEAYQSLDQDHMEEVINDLLDEHAKGWG